jgi:hypothetical protein
VLALHALSTGGGAEERALCFDVVTPTEREGSTPALRKLEGTSALYVTCDHRSGRERRFVPQRAVQYGSVGDDWLMLVASFGEQGIAWEGYAIEHPLRAPRSDDEIRARLWELPTANTFSTICVGVFDDRGHRRSYTLATSVGAAPKPDATRITRGDDGLLALTLADKDRASLEQLRVAPAPSS